MKRNPWLSAKEVEEVISHCISLNRIDYAIGIFLIYYYCLKPNELRILTPKDFDFGNCKILFSNNALYPEIKLDKDIVDNIVVLCQGVEQSDRIWKQSRQSWFYFIRNTFLTVLKKRVSPRLLYCSGIANLYNKGMDLVDAQKFARHDSIVSTAKYFPEPSMEEVHERVKEILNRG